MSGKKSTAVATKSVAKTTKSETTATKVAESAVKEAVKAVATPAPVATPEPVAETPVAAPATTEVNEAEVAEQEFTTLVSSLTEEIEKVSGVVRSLQQKLKAITKAHARVVKETAKRGGRRARRAASGDKKKNPSGFAKPSPISNELAKFLGEKEGTLMARTDVTKRINQYVKEHNLQDPTNKRTILPDEKLRGLLKVTASDKVTYFNLATFMKPHFIKA
jgi:chromatin remodeling complex protein RSC6